MAKTLLQNNKKIATATRSDMVFRPDGKSVEEALQDMPKSGIRELLKSAGATYNTSTGLYSLYPESGGLTDLTEAELLKIYNTYNGIILPSYISIFAGLRIRTNFKLNRNIALQSLSAAFMNSYIVVACLSVAPDNVTNCFRKCKYLERVIGGLDLRYCDKADKVNSTFKQCSALRDCIISNLCVDLSLADSPLFSRDSILQVIKRNLAKSNITITLHPQAFAVAMADAEIQEALANAPLVSLAQAE